MKIEEKKISINQKVIKMKKLSNSLFKKFEQSNGSVRLISINKAYDDIVIKNSDDFRIFGKVVG